MKNTILENPTLMITFAILISCILGFGTAGYERMMNE
tara:strand:+ start:153 stop:263 length:111 start_codon:yes stop_codon:yes gene_type:complete